MTPFWFTGLVESDIIFRMYKYAINDRLFATLLQCRLAQKMSDKSRRHVWTHRVLIIA